MAHTPEAVLKELKARQFYPVYFLHGEEPFFIDQITQLIEQTALAEHERSFNQLVVYGKETDLATVLSNARRYPMMSERSVVIVKEAQELADLNREGPSSYLEAYVEKPLPSTILVFAYKHKTLDGRKKLAKILDKHARLVESKKVADWKLAEWIASFIADNGFKAAQATPQMLADYLGNDLSRIANELDKLKINLKAGQEITPALIEQYIGISKDYNIFELQKALVSRDAYKAQQIIRYFAKDPKSHPLIPNLALLFNFFTRVLLGHASSDKSENGLAAALGLKPFVVKEYLQAMRVFPPGKVVDIIHFLRQADLATKGVDSGERSEEDILQELVFKIIH